MKSNTRRRSIVSLIIVACLLAVPVTAFARKGKDHFQRGLKYEQAQQWEKAAQEYTLALAADPSNVDYQLHFRRAVFNASQMFMQQGRSLAEQRDYVGAYNAFRQAFGYDPVNQLAVSEMERMVRLQQVKEGMRPASSTSGGDGAPGGDQVDGGGTPNATSNARPQEPAITQKPEQLRVVIYNNVDLKNVIRSLSEQLSLNVIFDRQSFAQPRQIDINLRDTTTARALDYIFLQENLFFQKLDRRTILVADQSRRAQYQQLVVRTFYIANADPEKVKGLISQALPASVGRPSSIVVPDKDTNSLTVRDTAENVRLIGELLQSIDKDRAEVVMDVNIYEVSRSNLLQLGNQMGGGRFNLGGSPGLSVLTSSAVTNGTQAGVNLSSIVGVVPTAAAAALVIPPSILTAFESKNNSKLLASTQIHAFNNEESTARIGQRVPVQTAQAFPFGVQTGTTTTPNPNQPFGSGGFPVINYEPTGLTLNFTPQVFPNHDVQVKMKIISKDVSGESTLTPVFTEREITGTARVQNNRTMMLASVTQDVQSSGRQGLPILGGLPIIGRFFTSPTRDNRQVDIVITVTPRVLRAPNVTPRDMEMRPSGTLQSPTTGSIAVMMEETAREEQQIAAAAARNAPKDIARQLPDAPPTYVPAAAATESEAAKVSQVSDNAAQAPATAASPKTEVPAVTVAAATQSADANRQVAVVQSDAAMPEPKAAAFSAPVERPPVRTLDVATALKSVMSPATAVSGTSSRQDVTVTPAVEGLAPKTEKTDAVAKPITPTVTVAELRLALDKNEFKVGEKRQIAVEFTSDAPLGLAVLMLRFDPRVIKVNSISVGGIFKGARTAPTLTQSIDEHGMVLVSLSPGAGSVVKGEGALLNLEIEAIGAGDSALAFDLSNVHLVARDGRDIMLQIEPIKLMIKQ